MKTDAHAGLTLRVGILSACKRRVRVSARALPPHPRAACRFDGQFHTRGRRERSTGGRTPPTRAWFYPEPLCRQETTILTRAAAEEPSSTDGGHRRPTRAENGPACRKEGGTRHGSETKAPPERRGPGGGRRSGRTPAPDNGRERAGQRKQFVLASEEQPSRADGESGLSPRCSVGEEQGPADGHQGPCFCGAPPAPRVCPLAPVFLGLPPSPPPRPQPQPSEER